MPNLTEQRLREERIIKNFEKQGCREIGIMLAMIDAADRGVHPAHPILHDEVGLYSEIKEKVKQLDLNPPHSPIKIHNAEFPINANGGVIDYKHRLGLYLGRFQPLHIGHASIIDQMLKECKSVVIAIGSAHESGTERNPFSYGLRKTLIEETYRDQLDRISIIPVYDREKYSDDPSWGDYLINNVLATCYDLFPDVIYEGDDSVNTNWYDDYDIPIVRVHRCNIPISGTFLRLAIRENNKDFVLSHLPTQIHKFYDELRKEIQNGTTD